MAMNRPNLMSDRVQRFIDNLNAERGRGDDGDEEDEELSHNERLRRSILDDEEGEEGD